MRYDAILTNGGIKSDFSSLISPLSTMFCMKKDKRLFSFRFFGIGEACYPCTCRYVGRIGNFTTHHQEFCRRGQSHDF